MIAQAISEMAIPIAREISEIKSLVHISLAVTFGSVW